MRPTLRAAVYPDQQTFTLEFDQILTAHQKFKYEIQVLAKSLKFLFE